MTELQLGAGLLVSGVTLICVALILYLRSLP